MSTSKFTIISGKLDPIPTESSTFISSQDTTAPSSVIMFLFSEIPIY